MAKIYDRTMRTTEERCLRQWRSELLAQATGELLEIGAGTGIDLPHYPAQIKTLTVSEPDPHMRNQLQKKLSALTAHQVRVADWGAEQVDLPDQSIDTIVSTLVLCSVPSPQQTLRELNRLLRPGGQLLFLEHVIATDSRTVHWQRCCEPLWRCCCGNCHLTRDTVRSIEASGMIIEQLREADMLTAPAIVRRTMRGRARKPGPHADNNS